LPSVPPFNRDEKLFLILSHVHPGTTRKETGQAAVLDKNLLARYN